MTSLKNFEPKYLVFDGACIRYYSSLPEALLAFTFAVQRYPSFLDIIELHKVLDFGAGVSAVLLRGIELK